MFDQIERDLLALTTAPLDVGDGTARVCVDEFANEFLGHWRMPPRRVGSPSPRVALEQPTTGLRQAWARGAPPTKRA